MKDWIFINEETAKNYLKRMEEQFPEFKDEWEVIPLFKIRKKIK